jgi:undecaprenyl-diphosphatase
MVKEHFSSPPILPIKVGVRLLQAWSGGRLPSPMFNAQPKADCAEEDAGPLSGRTQIFLGLALTSLLLVAAVSPYFAPFGENFHSVIAGCVYRSAQLSPESLEDRAAQKGISSVINLRGPNPGQDWYEQECAVARRQDLRFYDLPVDSQCPTPRELRELLRVLELCPKPVLIHCQSGIDRSGIVAAICVLLLEEAGSLEQARAHLGWRYGHMPWRDNLIPQERFLDDYQNWLTEHGQSHNRARFRAWILRISELGETQGRSQAAH